MLEGRTCSGQVFQKKVPLGGCSPGCRPWPALLMRGSAPGHTAWVLPPPRGPGCMAWLQTPPVFSAGCLWAVPEMHKCVWWPCSLSFLTYKKCDFVKSARKESRSCGNLSLAFFQGSFIQVSRMHRAGNSGPGQAHQYVGLTEGSFPLGCGGKAGAGRWDSRHQQSLCSCMRSITLDRVGGPAPHPHPPESMK